MDRRRLAGQLQHIAVRLTLRAAGASCKCERHPAVDGIGRYSIDLLRLLPLQIHVRRPRIRGSVSPKSRRRAIMSPK